MKKYSRSKNPFSIVHLFLILLIIILVNISLMWPQKTTSRATDYVLRSTVTYPTWGTVYTWKEKARVDVSVEHTYPISRVVFRLLAGNTSKNVCTVTTEPYTCTYTVPYTGGGTERGGNAGYAMEVYSWDTMGHVFVESLQLWSHK